MMASSDESTMAATRANASSARLPLGNVTSDDGHADEFAITGLDG
jgi:hypothetical protein